MRKTRWKSLGASLLLMAWTVGMAQAEEQPAVGGAPAAEAVVAAPKAAPFAVVGGQEISGERFRMAFQQWIQQKYYHGQVPGGEVAKIYRDVGDQLVDRALLIQEAGRRGLKADQEELDKVTNQYDQRYGESPVWKENREKMLATVTEELAARSVIKQLEKAVRTLPEPEEADIRAFYDKHPDKFTEPEDRKISLILLKVDPSAGAEAWKKAQEEAVEAVKQLRAGADFTEMARLRSGDTETADKGGRMKKSHRGMLAPAVEAAVDKMKPGEVSDPVTVLEGVAIFRLDKRVPPTRMDYDEDARKRASRHVMEEQAKLAWNELKQRLRKETPIEINEKDYYPPLPVKPPQEGKAKGGGRPVESAR